MAITITDKAWKEIHNIIEAQDIEDSFLRMGVAGGGCSGFSYTLTFENENTFEEMTDTVAKEEQGLKVVINKKSLLFMDGTTLDFFEDISQRGFVFDNPNANKSCGCGNSFSV